MVHAFLYGVLGFLVALAGRRRPDEPRVRAASTTHRSDRGGALRAADAGRRVRLGGWVHRRRDLGGLVFLDLRDRDGIVQVSFDPRYAAAAAVDAAAALTPESVVFVDG